MRSDFIDKSFAHIREQKQWKVKDIRDGAAILKLALKHSEAVSSYLQQAWIIRNMGRPIAQLLSNPLDIFLFANTGKYIWIC